MRRRAQRRPLKSSSSIPVADSNLKPKELTVLPVDWASLPPELVEAIGKKITVYADYIRFRGVCGPWRCCTERIPKPLPSQIPWLMLGVGVSSKRKKVSTSSRSFFDIGSNKIYSVNLPELSHLTQNYRICGSCNGWIVIVESEKTPSIFIFNPLTRERVDLPSLFSFPNVISFDIDRVGKEYEYVFDYGFVDYQSARVMSRYKISKIVLSGTPVSGGSFVAVALIYSSSVLAYCKSGDNSWKLIEETFSFAEDVTYLNGLFYSINNFGQIAVCDLDGDSPVVKLIFELDELDLGSIQYLVNSMGMLLLVTRFSYSSPDGECSTSFGLFKFDFCQENWVKMMSLGDMVLFVAHASSLALKASDFPGCKGNKIYFLDTWFSDNRDTLEKGEVGIFDLEDGTCRYHQLPCAINNYVASSSTWPHLLWIIPNPC